MIVERQCERSGKESPCLVTFAFMRDLALWRLQCCTHGAWCRTCPSGLGTSEASQTMAWMSRPCPTSMNHITTGLPCNGWPTRRKSMGWRASCMQPMCPWCDWACATYSWRAIIWTPRCSSSTIACFTVTTLASLRTPGSALLPRRGRKKLKRMKNMWGPPVATHSWPSGSMSGCPLRATTRTRQWASAGRRCQWQHPTFANARFLSANPPICRRFSWSYTRTSPRWISIHPTGWRSSSGTYHPSSNPWRCPRRALEPIHGRVLWGCWWRSWSPGVPDQ